MTSLNARAGMPRDEQGSAVVEFVVLAVLGLREWSRALREGSGRPGGEEAA